MRFLLIGPVINKNTIQIGGANVSFGHLVDYFKKNNLPFILVNTQYYPKGLKKTLNPVFALFNILMNLFRVDTIFLNVSDKGIKYLAPILYILAKLFKLKFVVRPFGGDFLDYTSNFSGLFKWTFYKFTLKADILFLQTKFLVDHFSSLTKKVFQLPTSRDIPDASLIRAHSIYRRKFIFLGFVNESKGVDHLLEAAKSLPLNYTIHIYGPIKDNYESSEGISFKEKFESQANIYQGVLAKENVLKTIKEYDVLVLPTYYRGEGYPGTIIEAYSLGLPVIATHWKSIPEIVEHGTTGVLINPRSTQELIDAIQFFNEDNYSKFSSNAKEYFNENFSTTQVNNRVIAEIQSLKN